MAAPPPAISPADVHVLLVDDDRLPRLVVASQLKKFNYKVTECESGLQAIDKLRTSPPGTYSIVLTDVMMPDVDGIELLRHVRADPALAAVPVVMMSANEHADTVFECIRAGAEDYLLKPVGRKDVQHIWQHAWRRQTAPASAAATAPSTAAAPPPAPRARAAAQPAPPTPAPGAVTLASYLSSRAPSSPPDPAAAFRLFCGALALLRPLHAAGAPLRSLRPSALVIGAGGAVASITPPGGVPGDEEAGYAAPEQLLGGDVGPPADVYALGVLLLELTAPPPPDPSARATTLAALRHRILPPDLLASRPREAAFVTALVHPDPASRPTLADVLTSGWLPALRDGARDAAAAAAAAKEGEEGEGAAAAPTAAAAAPPSSAAPAPTSPPTTRAGPACARPAPPPRASRDAGLLIQFLGMVRAARAAEAAAEAAALAALDADAAEVDAALGELGEAGGGSAPRSHAGASSGSSDSDRPPKRARAAAADAPPSPDGRDAAPVPTGAAGLALAAQSSLLLPHADGDGAAAAAWARVAPAAAPLEAAYLSTRLVPPSSLSSRPRLEAAAAAACDDATAIAALASSAGAPLPPPPRRAALRAFAADLAAVARLATLHEVARLTFDGPPAFTAASASSDMACALGFSRDDALFATAGVARRVRVFRTADVAAACPGAHCPVAEVAASAKLACLAWNPYATPLLLVGGYDGRVAVWDTAAAASSPAATTAFDATDRRIWSAEWWGGGDPRRFVAGGDDGVVRVWDLATPAAPVAAVPVGANVTSVAPCPSPSASHLLAAGAADGRAYVYDARRLGGGPLATLRGHARAVSYVRWAPGGVATGKGGGGGGPSPSPSAASSCGHLVTASTDGKLQRWDVGAALGEGGGRGGGGTAPSSAPPSPVATYRGHANERHFVGLAVAPPTAPGGTGGAVATGSEDDAVYVYCGGLATPVARHAMASPPGAAPSPPPAPGARPRRDRAGKFVSALAWSHAGGRLLAANSAGVVKLLGVGEAA